uniref:U29-Lycotoxin-Lsp1a_1 n=1 Tax=Lycosa sp. SGP-2016 TaxID=1905177 RepID=A0A482ZDT0_9ARAC
MIMSGVVLLGIIAFASLAKRPRRRNNCVRHKTQCINDLVQWCNSMKYPQQGAGISMLSVTYEDTFPHTTECFALRIPTAPTAPGTRCLGSRALRTTS